MHPGYRGIGIVEGQFLRISTTAATIWQQMMKTTSITTILKQNKHIKRTAGQILIAQLRDYHTRKASYNASYMGQPQTWWETCESKIPYLQLLAIKLFSVSPHVASYCINKFTNKINRIYRSLILK